MPKIYLAVGHGGGDPGATGGGWTEQSAGDVIVTTMTRRLRAAGADVKHEANQDDPNFTGTDDLANGWGADVCVAIHHDIRTAPTGSFAYHYPGSEQGRALARSIIAAVAADGRPTRAAWKGPGQGFAEGPVTGRDLSVLRNTAMPAVLLEVGPIGHTTLDEEAELAAFARVAADGIADHLGLTVAKADPADDGTGFEDVPADHRFAADIAYVAEHGLFHGHEGRFMPERPLTRGQAAAVFARLHRQLTDG